MATLLNGISIQAPSLVTLLRVIFTPTVRSPPSPRGLLELQQSRSVFWPQKGGDKEKGDKGHLQ